MNVWACLFNVCRFKFCKAHEAHSWFNLEKRPTPRSTLHNASIIMGFRPCEGALFAHTNVESNFHDYERTLFISLKQSKDNLYPQIHSGFGVSLHRKENSPIASLCHLSFRSNHTLRSKRGQTASWCKSTNRSCMIRCKRSCQSWSRKCWDKFSSCTAIRGFQFSCLNFSIRFFSGQIRIWFDPHWHQPNPDLPLVNCIS